MRDEVAIALLIVLVTASSGAGYYVGNSSLQTRTTNVTETIPTSSTVTQTEIEVESTTLTLTQSSTYTLTEVSSANASVAVALGCLATHPLEAMTLSNGTRLSPILLLQPGSTAHLCVSYFLPKGVYDFRLGIATISCTKIQPNGTNCAYGVSHSFAISSLPASANLNVSSYVTVLYAINSLDNSTGFYISPIPNPINWLVDTPLAVGYRVSQVNSSDFGGFIPAGPNGFPGYSTPLLNNNSSSIAVGFSGFNVTYAYMPILGA